jgi:carboxymethylenebutenolidase
MGAYWALWLADQKPEHIRAVTLFYGTGEGEFLNSQAAFMGHFADNDPYESEEWTKDTERRLKAAHRPVQFFMYPGGHWFFETDRPDAYNAEAAQLAWERTVAFLHEQLGGG